MQQDELNVLIDKTATLMAHYERRGERIDARLQELGEALQAMARHVQEIIKGSADGLLRTLPDQMSDRVRMGLDAPLQGYRESLTRARAEIDEAARELAGQIDHLRRMHRLLVWKTVGGAVVALALLVGGGAWLSMHYARVVRENQVTAELMRAYNRADVVLCGGRLCANVDTRGARYGDRGQYLPVKPR